MILSEFLSFIIMSPTQWVKKSVYRKSFTLNHILPKYGSCCTRSVCLHCLVMLEDPEMALFFFFFFTCQHWKWNAAMYPQPTPGSQFQRSHASMVMWQSHPHVISWSCSWNLKLASYKVSSLWKRRCEPIRIGCNNHVNTCMIIFLLVPPIYIWLITQRRACDPIHIVHVVIPSEYWLCKLKNCPE